MLTWPSLLIFALFLPAAIGTAQGGMCHARGACEVHGFSFESLPQFMDLIVAFGVWTSLAVNDKFRDFCWPVHSGSGPQRFPFRFPFAATRGFQGVIVRVGLKGNQKVPKHLPPRHPNVFPKQSPRRTPPISGLRGPLTWVPVCGWLSKHSQEETIHLGGARVRRDTDEFTCSLSEGIKLLQDVQGLFPWCPLWVNLWPATNCVLSCCLELVWLACVTFARFNGETTCSFHSTGETIMVVAGAHFTFLLIAV